MKKGPYARIQGEIEMMREKKRWIKRKQLLRVQHPEMTCCASIAYHLS
jgi:hypothetical protein